MVTSRYTQGKALFKEIHGEKFAEEATKNLEQVFPELARFTNEWIFNDIYARPQLTVKIRELVNIAALVTQGTSLPQVENHVRAAFRSGCTIEEIQEVILQMIIIVGFPNVVNTMVFLKKVFDELIMEA